METPKKTSHCTAVGQFVLTAARGEKIAAVEGLKLSGRMEKVVREASGGRPLSGDQRRALVKEALARK